MYKRFNKEAPCSIQLPGFFEPNMCPVTFSFPKIKKKTRKPNETLEKLSNKKVVVFHQPISRNMLKLDPFPRAW